jgi:hypothetical protein
MNIYFLFIWTCLGNHFEFNTFIYFFFNSYFLKAYNMKSTRRAFISKSSILAEVSASGIVPEISMAKQNIVTACEAGKDVYVEKPMAVSDRSIENPVGCPNYNNQIEEK